MKTGLPFFTACFLYDRKENIMNYLTTKLKWLDKKDESQQSPEDMLRENRKQLKLKKVRRMQRRRRIETSMNRARREWSRGMVKGILALFVIGLVSVAAYFGVKWWKGAGLQEEENAAIITALVGLFTVGATLYANYRSNLQNRRAFAHSRVYEQKMEAYTRMAELFFRMNHAFFTYDYTGEKAYGEEARELYFRVVNELVPKHLLFLSNEVLDRINDMARVIPADGEEDEREVEEKYAVFLVQFYEPLMDEFRKELGTESITEELRDMVQYRPEGAQHLF
jgi:hypothetical protein